MEGSDSWGHPGLVLKQLGPEDGRPLQELSCPFPALFPELIERFNLRATQPRAQSFTPSPCSCPESWLGGVQVDGADRAAHPH